jgi:hypothetical protein
MLDLEASFPDNIFLMMGFFFGWMARKYYRRIKDWMVRNDSGTPTPDPED